MSARILKSPILFGCLLACIFLCLSARALAQSSSQANSHETLPPSVVLVLKLISSTHVKPTTGIVISASGLVIVPADFVSAGDEIVVLDGGTDIARYGRPARTVGRSASEGIAVLSVEDLARSPVILSSRTLRVGDQLHYAAFPSAEKIAEGDQPLGITVFLKQVDKSSGALLFDGAQLPNLSGAIFDDCGQLAAVSLPQGIASLEEEELPLTLPAKDLRRILESMDLATGLAQGQCADQTKQSAEPRQAPPEKPGEANTPLPTDTSEPDPVEADPKQVPAPVAVPEQIAPQPARPTGIAPGDLQQQTDAQKLNKDLRFTILITFAVIAVLLMLMLFIKKSGKDDKNRQNGYAAPVEPETEQLWPRGENQRQSGFPVLDINTLSEAPPLPEGFDAMVLIEGRYRDGGDFICHRGVNPGNIRLDINLSDSAGLEIDDVGRGDVGSGQALVRLESKETDGVYRLTLSNPAGGSRVEIRGIPCLPGECLHIEPLDEISLAKLRFSVRLLGRKEKFS